MIPSAAEYLYVVNSPSIEGDLCRLEMKRLFGLEPDGRHFFAANEVSPSRSPFIRHRLSVLYSAGSLAELAGLLEKNRVAFSRFRFFHFKTGEDGGLDYEEWISSVKILGQAIIGEADMENPLNCLGATAINGRWIFGEYGKNDKAWKWHDKKTHTNSHSLGLKTARALVNIAVGNDPSCRLVDPCCGVGTVVLEAASMNVDVVGYEINRSVADKARENLALFGYEGIVIPGDMHAITDRFDAAIVDIPYGLFTPVTAAEQRAIIGTARRIADRMVIITFENMDEMILEAGFEIVDRCSVIKGKFQRFIAVCR